MTGLSEDGLRKKSAERNKTIVATAKDFVQTTAQVNQDRKSVTDLQRMNLEYANGVTERCLRCVRSRYPAAGAEDVIGGLIND